MSYEINLRPTTDTATKAVLKSLESLEQELIDRIRELNRDQVTEMIALTGDLESINNALRQLRDDIKDSEEE